MLKMDPKPFFEHIIRVKMFHFQTMSGFRHLKIDEYLTAFLELFDKLGEQCQGIRGRCKVKQIAIDMDTSDDDSMPEDMKLWIQELEDMKEKDSELAGIFDSMIELATKQIYLLSFNN